VFLDVFFLVWLECILPGNTWWCRLPEDGIEYYPLNPPSGGASSVMSRVQVWFRWISPDLVNIPSDIRLSSPVTVTALMLLFFGVLARRLSICLLQ
jgi:hypothetical protein